MPHDPSPATRVRLPIKMNDLSSLGKFRCIVADPPWELEIGKTNTLSGNPNPWSDRENFQIPYDTMTTEEMGSLELPCEPDCHLYIWTINKYIEQTYHLARVWGFDPSTMLYWIKQPMGIGLGGTFCGCVEPILFCRRGNLPAKRRLDRNWWGWPRGKHSAKPEEFQAIVESVSPGPYLEMFARRQRQGWTTWGNQVADEPQELLALP